MKNTKIKIKDNKGKVIDNKEFKNKLKYKQRQKVLDLYIEHEISRDDAINELKISESQFTKILKRYRQEGLEGLKHKLLNRLSNHASADAYKQHAIDLYITKYNGWNYCHACNKMEAWDNLVVHHNSLRNWLLDEKITKPKHKKKPYFKKREPMARFGDMVQVDGTFHDWFDDGNMYCLIHFVDDATKISLAMFFDGETTVGALTVLKLWCEKYGIPKKLYMDKDSVYRVNDKNAVATIEEELQGYSKARTNFAKVCDKLGIELIFANTPQAKGRVERRHGVFQDRCVKEFKLFGIKNMLDANEYLLKPSGFLDDINSQFTVPAKKASACIKLTQAETYEIFTVDEYRIVRNDYTISFNNVIYQLAKSNNITSKTKVIVKTHIDDKITISRNKYKLEYKVIENRKKPKKRKQLKASPYLLNYIRSQITRPIMRQRAC
jgi:transposase